MLFKEANRKRVCYVLLTSSSEQQVVAALEHAKGYEKGLKTVLKGIRFQWRPQRTTFPCFAVVDAFWGHFLGWFPHATAVLPLGSHVGAKLTPKNKSIRLCRVEFRCRFFWGNKIDWPNVKNRLRGASRAVDSDQSSLWNLPSGGGHEEEWGQQWLVKGGEEAW